MEKILAGWFIANSWFDPPMILMYRSLLASMLMMAAVATPFCLSFCDDAWIDGAENFLVSHWKLCLTFLCAASWMTQTKKELALRPPTDFVNFDNLADQRYYSQHKLHIINFYEDYIDGNIKMKVPFTEALQAKNEWLSFSFSWKLVQFYLWDMLFDSDQKLTATENRIQEHYDRGNSFFKAFLYPEMLYTSGIFTQSEITDKSYADAQQLKMTKICEWLGLQKTVDGRPECKKEMLDIGCGWGTLACYAAKTYGVFCTGVTLSEEGAQYAEEAAELHNVSELVDIRRQDFRDLSVNETFDAISAIEMAEHVGISNFPKFLSKVKSHLTDDGTFLMQVAGIRRGADWEDIQWASFMTRYIFPAANASLPLEWYVGQLEKAGFEVRSVENIGMSYSKTISKWQQRWETARSNGWVDAYAGRILRTWDVFLAWSPFAAARCSASCYQIVAHKNMPSFPRDRLLDQVPFACLLETKFNFEPSDDIVETQNFETETSTEKVVEDPEEDSEKESVADEDDEEPSTRENQTEDSGDEPFQVVKED